MAQLPIVKYPDVRLRQKCAPVETFDEDLRKLVADMADTMYAANGAGLAAIQVGVPLRLFIIEPEVAGRPATDPVIAFINPEIVMISDEAQTGDEGLPVLPGRVRRGQARDARPGAGPGSAGPALRDGG